jgi:hypothetical protein
MAPRSSFTELVIGAYDCALELRQVEMGGVTVHVAISCGDICFGLLGGYEDRWECLVSGRCIEQLSQCLDDAPSGHAVCTHNCISVLDSTLASHISTERLASGSHRLIPVKPSEGISELLQSRDTEHPVDLEDLPSKTEVTVTGLSPKHSGPSRSDK